MPDPVAGISLRGIVVGNGEERELLPYYKVPFTHAEFQERLYNTAGSYKAIFIYPNEAQSGYYSHIPYPLYWALQAIIYDNWVAGGNVATYMQDATPGTWRLLKDDAPSTISFSSFTVSAGDITTTNTGGAEITRIDRVGGSARWAPTNVSRLAGPQTESGVGTYPMAPGDYPTLMIADSSGVLFRLVPFMDSNVFGWLYLMISSVNVANGTESDFDTVHIKDISHPLDSEPNPEGNLAMTRYDPRASTGSMGIYLLDRNGVSTWTIDLWETDLVESIRSKFIGDGRNAVLGLRWFFGLTDAAADQLAVRPATPIKLGNVSFELTAPTSSEDWVVYDFGTVAVEPYYGDHRDYSATTYQAYLPFVGVVDLDPNDVVGQNVSLAYVVNITDGSATVIMFTGSADNFPSVDGLIFSTTTAWGYDIPLQIDSVPSMNAALIAALTRVGGGAAGGAAVGGVPGAAVGGALGLISAPTATGPSYSAGTLAPNANVAGDFAAKIIVYRNSDLTGDIEGTLGTPTGDTMLVSEASGYLQVAAVVNSGQLAAIRRGDEIIAMLKEGVYL